MRVIMFKEKFKSQIISGEKFLTIRKKAGCKRGDVLSLRCWSGRPYRSKHEIFATKICEFVEPITIDKGRIIMNQYEHGILNNQEMEIMAVNDGFESFKEMEEFFNLTHGLPFSGEVISWSHGITS